MESWVQFDFFLQTNFKQCADLFILAQTYLLTHTIHKIQFGASQVNIYVSKYGNLLSTLKLKHTYLV